MNTYTVEIKNITAPDDKLAKGETRIQTIQAADKNEAQKKAMRNLFGLGNCVLDQKHSDGSEHVMLTGDGRNRSGATNLYGKIYVYVEEVCNA